MCFHFHSIYNGVNNLNLFLLGDPFCALRCHLDGWKGLVVADPTEKRLNVGH